MLAEEEPVSQIAPGDDLSVTLLSQNGHPAKENVTVLENGASFSSFTYSEETGLLVVDGASIGSGKTLYGEGDCSVQVSEGHHRA